MLKLQIFPDKNNTISIGRENNIINNNKVN